jgi:hypothetical protein
MGRFPDSQLEIHLNRLGSSPSRVDPVARTFEEPCNCLQLRGQRRLYTVFPGTIVRWVIKMRPLGEISFPKA